MGNSLACCGKNESDPNNLDTTKLGNYQGATKLRSIIRIQSIFRGYMARKRVKALKETYGVKSMMNHFDFTGPANYDNPEVQVS